MRFIRKNEKVFVAMSGGVDSSVAALLLKRKGYDVTGVFMRNWHEDLHDGFGECAWERDQEDVRRVCAKLDIPFYTWDFSKEYYEDVVEYFFSEYEAGRTPNPDVMCNKYIKFGKFYERARALGADFVATGHYVRCRRRRKFSIFKFQFSNSCVMREGVDPNKDQSYFLWAITSEHLKHSLFPIGEYHKPKIRKIAKKANLPTANKPDSQGICFIGKINVQDFLRTRLPEKPGDIVTLEGEVIGRHKGLYFYTEGQRGGIGIGGSKQPYYVAERDFENNKLVVVEGSDNPALFSSSLSCSNIHWIGGDEPRMPFRCFARIRYHQAPQRCVLEKSKNGISVEFEEKQRAISPGQSIVFYDGDICMGGAIIDARKIA